MKNFKRFTMTLGLILLTLVSFTSYDALTIQNKQLPNYGTQGSNNYPQVIVSHESGNANNTSPNAVYNEMAYMERMWNQTYGNSESAHYWVGDGGKVFQLVSDRMVAFHAGSWANMNGIGIELARTNDKNQFKKDYASYVELHRMLGKKYGIPMTLDDGVYRGVKSHLWISNNVWGDHVDPYAYLQSMGISKTQFAKDLKNGVNPSNVKPVVPEISTDPTPDKTTLKVGSKVEVKKAVQYGTNKPFYANGKYDVLEVKGTRVVIGKGKVVTTAIHSNNLKYTTSTTSPTQKPSSNWYNEKGTFTPNTAINVRYSPSVKGKYSGTLYRGQSINYNAVTHADGYVWVRYESYGGTRYMAVRPIGGNAYGTFK